MSRTIARASLTFSVLEFGQEKSAVRSRWVEINGTDSLTTQGTKGSYYTVKKLALKYGSLVGSLLLGYNGKIVLYNDKFVSYRGLRIIDLDIAYELLRNFLINAGLNDGNEEFIDFDWTLYSELLAQYCDAETVALDSINDALQKYTDESQRQILASLRAFETLVNDTFDEFRDILDNTIETYFYSGVPSLSTLPASGWSVSEYESHLGDMYYDNDTGTGYRFQVDNGTYFWKVLSDSTATQALAMANLAKDTADHKRRVFLIQPTSADAYDVGDIWLNATISGTASGDVTNEMLVATTAKAANITFSAAHWTLATKYTNDAFAQQVQSQLNTFINTTYANAISDLISQVDSKAETFFSATDPSANWSAEQKTAHIGDLWHNTANTTISGTGWSVEGGQSAIWDGSKWVVSAVPTDVFDRIDGKAALYTTWGSWNNSLRVRDIYIPYPSDETQGGVTYRANKFYRCISTSPITFVEIGYTDDSGVNYLKTALSNDNTVISGGLVLGSFIGVKNSSNNIVAAINGSSSLQGWQNNTHGTLMIAAGITSIGSSNAEASASTKIYEDGTIITNSIYATGGTVGGWTLGATMLSSGSSTTFVGLDSGTSDVDYAIWAGAETPSNAPFSVSRGGYVVAEQIDFGGFWDTVDDGDGNSVQFSSSISARRIDIYKQRIRDYIGRLAAFSIGIRTGDNLDTTAGPGSPSVILDVLGYDTNLYQNSASNWSNPEQCCIASFRRGYISFLRSVSNISDANYTYINLKQDVHDILVLNDSTQRTIRLEAWSGQIGKIYEIYNMGNSKYLIHADDGMGHAVQIKAFSTNGTVTVYSDGQTPLLTNVRRVSFFYTGNEVILKYY